MKFDGNLAWKQASATVTANRELLLALAGVFFFLPSFALIMLFKQPQIAPGATPEQMMPVLREFISTMAPWFVIGSVIQALGQLTLAELLGRGGQSTVGQALRQGVSGLLAYVAVQIMTGFMAMSVLVLASAIVGLVSPVLGLMVGLYLVVQVYARFVTASVVVALERQRNPFAALVRSVALSRGNGFRIGNFLFLLAVAIFALFAALSIVAGIIAALTIGEGRTAEIVTGFISSAASAAAMTYFVAIIVAIYRQLMGEAPANIAEPFE